VLRKTWIRRGCAHDDLGACCESAGENPCRVMGWGCAGGLGLHARHTAWVCVPAARHLTEGGEGGTVGSRVQYMPCAGLRAGEIWECHAVATRTSVRGCDLLASRKGVLSVSICLRVGWCLNR